MSKEFNGDLIREVAEPLWNQMISENPFAFRTSGNDELVLQKGFEDFTFNDFCDEIRLELQNADARN